ncbi:Hsp33 family molecular chaperone HslO [Ideonella sp. 4Y16]|uniref:Hsp33 family molecular chaperone HslO n=1 Tax=Ideonella alba TaxID=2824118 RepID=UPI001B35837C|nr:Hsp33 family molecular chaperone HslO [Ideonella alba]MBQ0944834.1 Hsp33 family molecular chaperone HslO [Ideonella alba]
MSELHKFIFEGLPVRGMLVRLTDSWREVLARRQEAGAFPPEVRTLLGEMAAAATLMQANIKFNGALILQVLGDGPVKLAVAEANSELGFRATAKVVGEVPAGAQLEAMLNVHGQGRCAITLDPKDRLPGQQPYQGVVPLHGDQREPLQQLSQVLEHYMLQSEQLDTRLVLAANDEIAAGLLIQRLPVEGEGNLGGRYGAGPSQAGPSPLGGQPAQPAWGQSWGNEDEIGLSEAFNRIAHLSATLTAEELLTLDADTILRRLFWEETVRRFEPLAPRFACSCSPERVRGMLSSLGREEADSIIAERGEIEVGCDFCGRHYRFDAVDVGELFTPGAHPGDEGATRH